MNKQKRKAVIAGNWKMNKIPAEASALVEEIKLTLGGVSLNGIGVVVGVPFVDIAPASKAAEGSDIKISAQNVHWAASGAFTGEISADMLKAAGAEYVIIGHSERRQFFGETDETVNLRLKAALAAGLIPIVCVGELKEQRLAGITEEVVAMQTKLALSGISKEDMAKVIIAYEPVWAIGTGLTATAAQAEEVCAQIRSVVAKLYDASVAEGLTVQYGGSMNAANASELLSMENVDGGLIGGASLKASDFYAIIEAAIKG